MVAGWHCTKGDRFQFLPVSGVLESPPYEVVSWGGVILDKAWALGGQFIVVCPQMNSLSCLILSSIAKNWSEQYASETPDGIVGAVV